MLTNKQETHSWLASVKVLKVRNSLSSYPTRLLFSDYISTELRDRYSGFQILSTPSRFVFFSRQKNTAASNERSALHLSTDAIHHGVAGTAKMKRALSARKITTKVHLYWQMSPECMHVIGVERNSPQSNRLNRIKSDSIKLNLRPRLKHNSILAKTSPYLLNLIFTWSRYLVTRIIIL